MTLPQDCTLWQSNNLFALAMLFHELLEKAAGINLFLALIFFSKYLFRLLLESEYFGDPILKPR